MSTSNNPTGTFQTKDTVAPTKPVSVNAVAKPWPTIEIDLDWADSTDDVAVTGYTVWRSTAGAGGPWTQIATPTTSSFADTSATGLVTAKQYWYYVTAHDAVPNTSTASAVVTASTPDNQPPTIPGTPTSPSKTGSTVTSLGSVERQRRRDRLQDLPQRYAGRDQRHRRPSPTPVSPT